MLVERVKYTIWAADMERAVRFYRDLCGTLTREPEPENGEPPHLAMCVDTEGNEFMLFRKRH